MEKKIFNISHSLLNDFNDFTIGKLCGLQFKAIHVDKILKKDDIFEFSEYANAGNFFEFKCTGALPRDGQIPIPKTTKNGLDAKYNNLLNQAEHFRRFAAEHITNIERSAEYRVEYEGIMLKGIADIKCLFDGKPALIDLKATSVIDDKWSDNSWRDIRNKREKTRQAIIYIWMAKQIEGIDYDFYFYVASMTDSVKRKIIKIKPNAESFNDLINEIKFVHEMIEYHNNTGWRSGAEYNIDFYETCSRCPKILSDNCKQKILNPTIIDMAL